MRHAVPHQPDLPQNHHRSLLNRVLSARSDAHTHITELSGRTGVTGPWPDWVPTNVRQALRATGITAPWTHQLRTAELAAAGQDVVLATGTNSGKSLGYHLPILSALANDATATALYIAPTKALSADQLRTVNELTTHRGLHTIAPAQYDGDTPTENRPWVRRNARWIFTNPDMLHLSMLPGHRRWSRILRRLRYVVIDECHTYRGVFGSHVALVLRRLTRLATHYGANPVFVLCSATTADPGAAATQLIGRPCIPVTEDASPQGPRTIALHQPATQRDTSRVQEAARLFAKLVVLGTRTLVFVRSRRDAELVVLAAQELLTHTAPELAARIASYRGGYLAEDRRYLEAALGTGALLGVATTNALELGVDIAGVDAVVLSGFPGMVSSFWQQAGRAGRRGSEAMILLVATEDPLDTYLVRHPKTLLEAPIEATVIDPKNPYLLGPHLLCAALELPLTGPEVTGFRAGPALAELCAQGLMRRRDTPPRTRRGATPTAARAEERWHATTTEPIHDTVDIRGGIHAPITIVDGDTGRILGTADAARAPATLHAGAVHLHRGQTYVVDELSLTDGFAVVHAADPGWTTSARRVTSITVDQVRTQCDQGACAVTLAEVDVTSQVVGYVRTLPTGEVLEQVSLTVAPQTLHTTAVFYTVRPELLRRAGITKTRLAGALHAAEHAAIGLLPLFASCDRWDIGGVSSARHPDTGLATVFVYDGTPGGSGFAERGFTQFTSWLAATLAMVDSCGCRSGCPACVQSPKCGSGNTPLHKPGAVRLLSTVLNEVERRKMSGH